MLYEDICSEEYLYRTKMKNPIHSILSVAHFLLWCHLTYEPIKCIHCLNICKNVINLKNKSVWSQQITRKLSTFDKSQICLHLQLELFFPITSCQVGIKWQHTFKASILYYQYYVSIDFVICFQNDYIVYLSWMFRRLYSITRYWDPV